jgi:uncharacterized protein YegP (UPF0339 family)
MEGRDAIWQERKLEEILSKVDPASKVLQIIRLGFDPEVADKSSSGTRSALRLPFDYQGEGEPVTNIRVVPSSHERPLIEVRVRLIYHWVLVAANGEVLAISETYFSKSNASRAAVKLRNAVQVPLRESPRRF